MPRNRQTEFDDAITAYERGRGMNAHCETKLKNPRATPHRRTRPSARIIKRRLSHGYTERAA